MQYSIAGMKKEEGRGKVERGDGESWECETPPSLRGPGGVSRSTRVAGSVDGADVARINLHEEPQEYLKAINDVATLVGVGKEAHPDIVEPHRHHRRSGGGDHQVDLLDGDLFKEVRDHLLPARMDRG